MIQGDAALAFLKVSLTAFSLSPTHLERNSGPFTEIKLTSLSWASALANNVLPVPGGPYSKIPLGGFEFKCVYSSGYFKGHSIISLNCNLASSKPPTSSHVSLG